MAYRIGEVCHRLNIDASTLRKWERAGLVPKSQRTAMGFRVYTEEEIEKLRSVVTNMRQHREHCATATRPCIGRAVKAR